MHSCNKKVQCQTSLDEKKKEKKKAQKRGGLAKDCLKKFEK